MSKLFIPAKMTKGLGFIEWSLLVSLFTGLVQFVNTYVFADWHFVITLMVIIGADTALGLYVAYKHKHISSKGFAKMFNKVIVYMMFLICTHVATHISAQGKEVSLLSWMDSAIYSAIVVREILSIFEKCALINPTLIPVWILKRLKYFDDTGNVVKPEDQQNQPA